MINTFISIERRMGLRTFFELFTVLFLFFSFLSRKMNNRKKKNNREKKRYVQTSVLVDQIMSETRYKPN